jgi:predicted transcriptional regulator
MTQHPQTPPPKTRRRSTTVHVKVSGEVLEKLDEMAGVDRRDRPEFLRLLVEDEWKRRQTAAAGNGAKP